MPLSEHQRRRTLITNQLLPWQFTWTPFLSNNYVIIFCPRPISLWNTLDLKSVHKLIRIRSLMIPPQAPGLAVSPLSADYNGSLICEGWVSGLSITGNSWPSVPTPCLLMALRPVLCVPTLGLPWGTCLWTITSDNFPLIALPPPPSVALPSPYLS